MPNKMLIDASHPEETRVVVIRGNRIEEFDFESQDKKQLKGNIYLARVTRVEPSLQAAFVEYGGNRHGFLAFSEIHPDYYQIPIADRQALLRAEAEADESDDEDESDGEERGERGRGKRRRRGGRHRGREERQASGEAGDSDAPAAARERAAPSDDDHEATDDPARRPSDAAPDDGDRVEVEALAQPDPDVVGETSEEVIDADAAQTSPSDGDAEAPSATGSRGIEDAEDEASSDEAETSGHRRPGSIAASVDADVISEPIPAASSGEDADSAEEASDATGAGASDDAVASESESRGVVEEVHAGHADESEIESVGAEDALEEIRNRRRPMRRHYKIQEVIKRRQILLVQVVKEERGNKGAALTTYLSLAGRYSVLMPNTARGGGISRKITNAQDRKRLKEVVAELDVPEGMGVILRTAGESRTKAEIKRDYEYLMRLWENVRTLTLESTAPALVYEEGSLIKRSVRDLYNKDIDEILVSGEDGYREAKDFMRMLMPSHAKVVQPYRDSVPIFARAGIEAQLDKMLQPQVTLKSGGYIIINQTEALVSIDVNSGRSTKEHSIEDTALQTNLEAADEVARQLRLRDLAGLIVIDFIDMEENRNNRAVEKRLKDCLKNDRARIQVGRISHFGLLEMSRQRIRASVLESTMKPCPHCGGTGHVRSDSSVALHVVRAVEEFLLRDSRSNIIVRTPAATALYVLNHKRGTLVEMERRFGVTITLEADETLGAQQPYAISRGAIAEKPAFTPDQALELPPPADVEDEEEGEPDIVEDAEAEAPGRSANGEHHGDGEHHDRKRRRRRRRRGGGRDREHGANDTAAEDVSPTEGDTETVAASEAEQSEPDGQDVEGEPGDEGGSQKKRRRGKRGGRRNKSLEAAGDVAEDVPVDGEAEPEAHDEKAAASFEQESIAETIAAVGEVEPDATAEQPPSSQAPHESEEPKPALAEEAAADLVAEGSLDEGDGARLHRTRRRSGSDSAPAEPVVVSAEGKVDEAAPKKGGWWQRKSFF